MDKNSSKKGECGVNHFKRARYFHGMLLTDRDFREEQIYHNEKRKLLNKLLHGWGVVCGLKIKPTNPVSASAIIEPGVALDCHGNEIVVCESQTVNVLDNIRSFAQNASAKEPCAEYQALPIQPQVLYIVIRYDEKKTDPVPVYVPGGSCEEKTCDYSRTQEGFCIEVWDSWPDEQPTTCRDISETGEGGFEPCKEPYPCPQEQCCPETHYILLATISCGARRDLLTAKSLTEAVTSAKIRYWIDRNLSKVCLSREAKDAITIESIHEFDTKEAIDENTIAWNIDAAWKLPAGLTIQTGPSIESMGRSCKTTISMQAGTTAPDDGTAIIEIPLSLSYKTRGTTINWTSKDLPLLKSPIEISLSSVRQSKVITEAFIRNVACRKFVPTFAWMAWIFEHIEEEPAIPWSGDVSRYCLPKIPSPAIQPVVNRAELDAKIQASKQELVAKVEKVEKKNENGLKKMQTNYEKRISELTKRIEALEKKKTVG